MTDLGTEQRALPETWVACLLAFRYEFNLPLHDARVARIPADRGVHRTLAQHRAELLQALEAGDTARAKDKCELLWRTVELALAKPIARTGLKVRRPHAESNRARAVASSKRVAEWQTLAGLKWKEPQHADKSASAIAKLIARPGEKWNTIRRKIKKPE